MFKMLKTIGSVALAIVVTAGAGFGYLYFRSPASSPAADLHIEATPERLARGEYIFTVLSDCDGCHSERDFSRFGGPVKPGRRGVGGPVPLDDLPGKVFARNITPDPETGLGRWTDGEIVRAIRDGVSRDGSALFSLMPYANYRYMADEDVYSLVAYLRSLPPVRNEVPRSQIGFPVSLLMKGDPRPAGLVPAVDRTDRLAYGQYLVTMASCEECHTPLDKGRLVAGKNFGGGHRFGIPGGPVVHSANISSDKATGIGTWDYQRFRDRLAAYRNYEPEPAGPDQFTLMPWLNYGKLSDEDVAAIWEYIRTRPPVENKVNPRPAVESSRQ